MHNFYDLLREVFRSEIVGSKKNFYLNEMVDGLIKNNEQKAQRKQKKLNIKTLERTTKNI